MFLSKIKAGIKEHGLMIYTVYIIRIFLEHTCKTIRLQFVYLFLLPVDTKKLKIPAFLSKRYHVKVLDHYNDLLKDFPVSRTTADYRFKQKAVCLVLLKNNHPIGYLWLIREKYQEDIMFCTFTMADQIAWDFEVWIHDDFRLTPAFSVLWQKAFEYLAENKIKYVFSRIGTTNNNSVHVHSRLGGHIVGKLLFFRFYTHEICIDTVSRKMSLHNIYRRKIIDLRNPNFKQ